MRHPRHQVVANATMDEVFLQAGVMGCSSGFGACGRLGFTAALGSSTYSGVLKEVTGPVRLPGAQESQRADVCNAQEPLTCHRGLLIVQACRRPLPVNLSQTQEKDEEKGTKYGWSA
jgi:hypothetical protein